MSVVAFVFILISSVFLGIMAMLRKEYQIINGTTMTATIFFILFISIIGGMAGLLLSGGIDVNIINIGFAFIYALISTVTASICIYATAYGSVSELMLWALLGSLVLPSAFGLITQPAENELTIYKIIGFLAALVCMGINFINNSTHKKSDLRFKVLCGIVFLTNGSALIVFNLKNRFCENISNISFVAEYMFISILITAVCLLIIRIKNKTTVKEIKSALNKKSVVIMVAYSALFLVSEILALKCAGLVPLIMQAPVTFAVPIITTAIIDYVIYKVKLKKLNVIQLCFACMCCIGFMLEG